MSKIGKDVLSAVPVISSRNKRLESRLKEKQKILLVLDEYRPKLLNISQLQRITGLNWITVRDILRELEAEGKVKKFHSGNAVWYKAVI